MRNKLNLFFSLLFLSLIFFLVYVSFKDRFLYKKEASEMPLGQAIELNGQASSPEYVSVPGESLYPGKNFTVEAWIKPSLAAPPSYNQTINLGILTKKAVNATQTEPQIDDYGLSVEYTGQNSDSFSVHYQFIVYSGETTTNCTPLRIGAAGGYRKLNEVNKWTHVAGVIDNGYLSIYVDGKRLHTATEPYMRFKGNYCAKKNPLLIGAGPGSYFQGAMDEVRISSVARYVDDFTPTFSGFAPDWDTIAIWHFDGDASDRNGLGSHNGTVVGSVNYIEGVVQKVDPTLTITPTPVVRSRVFVTSTTYTGNLGGVTGADAKCQERADAEKLGGKWKAWLSDGYMSANDRLHHSQIPYKLLNYTVIADNWDDLVTNFHTYNNPLGSPINVYENRQVRQSGDGPASVWTNTLKNANASDLSCDNWTVSSGTGNYGSVASIGEAWTAAYNESNHCGNKYRLYCFEQPDVPTPTPANLRIFVTSNTYSGNLGGVGGADAKCQASADAVNLVGVWKAWLSSTLESASSRLVHSQVPYKLINDFTPVANNWADLTDQTLINKIDLTETGQSIRSVPNYWDVWTNTWTSGYNFSAQIDDTCNNWTSDSSAFTGSGGATNAVDFRWTGSEHPGHSCNSAGRLYCVEQMRGVTPTPTSTPTPVPPTPTPVPDEQAFTLQEGWNWVSLNVQPTDSKVTSVFAPVMSKLNRVLAETTVFSNEIPAESNSLKNLETGKLYLVYMNEAASLTVSGIKKAANTPINLHQGWNWMGYYPTTAQGVSQALASMGNKYQLVHGFSGSYAPSGEVNDLVALEPGQGYLIYMNEAATLVYPQAVSGNTQPKAACKVVPTSQFTYLTRLDPSLSVKVSPGVRYLVEAVNAKGEVCGCALTTLDQPIALRLYGAQTLNQLTLPGFSLQEAVYVQVKDPSTAKVLGKLATGLSFVADYQLHPAGGLSVPSPKLSLPPTKIPTRALCPPGQTKPYYKKTRLGCQTITACGLSSCTPKR